MDRTIISVKSPAKVTKWIEVKDLFFVLAFTVATYFALAQFVNERLKTIFIIYNVVVALFLTARTNINSKRRNYENVYFLFTKDRSVFKNLSD